jgi:hypothetical protein
LSRHNSSTYSTNLVKTFQPNRQLVQSFARGFFSTHAETRLPSTNSS